MNSGFLNPWEPVFMASDIPIYGFRYTKNTSKNIRKYGHFFEKDIFISLKLMVIQNVEMLDHIWKRRAPNIDEDPFNKKSRNHGYGINNYQKT